MSVHVTTDRLLFPAINTSAAEIRLLEIQPGDESASVECKYRIASLNDEGVSFEALSYAWGDGRDHDNVCINGTMIRVSLTLFNAIRRLRLVDDTRLVWIDALCINQADDYEKTDQVNMMRRIYTQCKECAIWLGDLDQIQRSDAQAALDAITIMAGETTIANPPDWDQTQAPAALEAMMNTPWWGRIWTVQEAVLPPRATLYWGPCQLDWKLMHRAADNLLGDGEFPDVPWEVECHFDGMLHFFTSPVRGLAFTTNESSTLLLWRWRHRQATDPRDKVYGLMGIRERSATHPSVRSCDYTVDVVTLYSRTVIDLIRENGNLLALIGRGGSKPMLEGLPSWAMDWQGTIMPRNGGGRISGFWETLFVWLDRGFTADRGIHGVGDGLQVLDEKALCLAGFYIDKVAVTERLFDDDRWHASGSAMLLSCGERWGRVLADFQEQGPASRRTSEVTSKLVREFIGLATGKLVPADPNDGDDMNHWMEVIVRHHSFFITEQGRVGLGPLDMEPGQEVWILGGCRFPVILERRGSPDVAGWDKGFSFVAESYVYGIMKGEAVEGREDEQHEILLY